MAWHFHLMKRGPLPDSKGFASELPQVEIGAHVEWTDGKRMAPARSVIKVWCVWDVISARICLSRACRIKAIDGFVVMLEQV